MRTSKLIFLVGIVVPLRAAAPGSFGRLMMRFGRCFVRSRFFLLPFVSRELRYFLFENPFYLTPILGGAARPFQLRLTRCRARLGVGVGGLMLEF